MLFLSVRGFFDYAGPADHSRLSRSTVLPSPLRQKVGVLIHRLFEAQSPAHRYLYLRFERHLTMSPARLEARMDSLFSFPVGLFHPLRHAGLSRRSTSNRETVDGKHVSRKRNSLVRDNNSSVSGRFF